MNWGMKREIRAAVANTQARHIEIWSPRASVRSARRVARWFEMIVYYGGELGMLLALLVSAPVWGPFILVAWRAGGMTGAVITGGVLAVATLILFAQRSASAARLKKILLASPGSVCLWCQSEHLGPEERGWCGACGRGFDRGASERLVRLSLGPYWPDSKTLRRRSRWLWARAIRERDRPRPCEPPPAASSERLPSSAI